MPPIEAIRGKRARAGQPVFDGAWGESAEPVLIELVAIVRTFRAVLREHGYLDA